MPGGILDYLGGINSQMGNFYQNNPNSQALAGAASGLLARPYDTRAGMALAGQGMRTGMELDRDEAARRERAMAELQRRQTALQAGQSLGLTGEMAQFGADNPSVIAEKWKNQNRAPTTTDDVREYQFAVKQGYKGTLLDFMTETKKAGATQVNVGPQGNDYGKPEAGRAWMRNPDGTIKTDERGLPIAGAYQGGSVYGKEQAEQQAAEQRQGVQQETEARKAGVMLDAVTNARELVTENGNWATGTGSVVPGWASFTAAGKLRSYIEPLTSGVALSTMMELKKASSSGATGFGAMNEKELGLLIADMGALDPDTTDPEIFLATLDRIETRYQRVVEDIRRNVSPERQRELGLDTLLGGQGSTAPQMGGDLDTGEPWQPMGGGYDIRMQR